MRFPAALHCKRAAPTEMSATLPIYELYVCHMYTIKSVGSTSSIRLSSISPSARSMAWRVEPRWVIGGCLPSRHNPCRSGLKCCASHPMDRLHGRACCGSSHLLPREGNFARRRALLACLERDDCASVGENHTRQRNMGRGAPGGGDYRAGSSAGMSVQGSSWTARSSLAIRTART